MTILSEQNYDEGIAFIYNFLGDILRRLREILGSTLSLTK
jgi:hypothetical protein